MANTSLYNTLFSKIPMVMKGGLSKPVDILALLNMKKELFIMIFLNLIVQVTITYYVMMNFNLFRQDTTNGKNNNGNNSKLNKFVFRILLFVALFVLIFIINMPMPSWMRFIIFSFISTIFGAILSNLKYFYGVEIIKAALLSTIGIFVTFLLIGIAIVSFGIKLGVKTLLFLLCSLLLFIITKLVFMFAGNYSNYVKSFAIIGLSIFAAFIIYDTNIILRRDYQGDFITASLDYYLDIINTFVNVLHLGGNE